MRIFDGKVYRDMTAQELAAREQEIKLARAKYEYAKETRHGN